MRKKKSYGGKEKKGNWCAIRKYMTIEISDRRFNYHCIADLCVQYKEYCCVGRKYSKASGFQDIGELATKKPIVRK